MPANALTAGATVTHLRRRIAAIEGRPAALAPGGDARPATQGSIPPPATSLSPRRGGMILPFGVPVLDDRLAGGLRRNALHEVRTEITRNAGSASGFAVALLARLTAIDDRPVLWVIEASAAREGGVVHGPGLAQLGLPADRLVLVRVRRPQEALWVFEEGLRSAGLAAVLAEIRGHPSVLDLSAGRRLALRARDGGVMGLLLRQAANAEPGAAATRWRVSPQPAAIIDDFAAGIGRPVWRLDLERNRTGPTGRFDLEWDHGNRSFALARPPTAALSDHCPAVSADRSDLAYAAGAVVALRRTG
ncbi:ImuA family protein [Bauldia sp.]|uniref:ImuA family protein n=1 Tax=Bauldia sp. TaxID=2575872 RepID=UPI003BA91FE0